MEIQNRRWKILSCLGLAFPFLLASHDAQSQADFYKGKTITFIQATEPGGTGDLRARALISSLQKHIPGNPAIISEYMPGGGGRKAANHMYKVARPDGLTFAWVSVGAINSAVLREPGFSTISTSLPIWAPRTAERAIRSRHARKRGSILLRSSGPPRG